MAQLCTGHVCKAQDANDLSRQPACTNDAQVEAMPGGFTRKTVHLKLSGFGPGREAASRAITGATSVFQVKRITDVTPVRHGGCRPKKARRL